MKKYIELKKAVQTAKYMMLEFMNQMDTYEKPILDALEYSLEAEAEPFVYLLEGKHVDEKNFKTIGIFTTLEELKNNKLKYVYEYGKSSLDEFKFKCKRYVLDMPGEITDL